MYLLHNAKFAKMVSYLQGDNVYLVRFLSANARTAALMVLLNRRPVRYVHLNFSWLTTPVYLALLSVQFALIRLSALTA